MKLLIEKGQKTIATLEFDNFLDMEDYINDNYNDSYEYWVENNKGICMNYLDLF